MELVEFYLEQLLTTWNMFLGESVVKLLESDVSFTYVFKEAVSVLATEAKPSKVLDM